MTHAYYWDDDRKPLPRATRCLEDELLPDVEVATDRAYVKAPKKKAPRADDERHRAYIARKIRARAVDVAMARAEASDAKPYRRNCLWCTATTRRADQCCGSRACEVAAEAEFHERRLRRMGRVNDR